MNHKGGRVQLSNFITALIKMRKDARKAQPDTSGRLKEILAILNKYNYDNGITPDIVANILQDLGPTFVKIGQIASQQGDYIPKEYVEALMKLRSKVQPMDLDTVYSQIEKYLGKPVNALFASFSEKPLGSASVGQVHKATLFDGTVVAVKVRRPGVVDTVARDFALIEKILDQFVKGDLGGFDIKGFILELEKTSKTELDFTNEANNLLRFWENNNGRERVVAPKCYSELTCEAVLTEDFVMGNEVSDIDFINTLREEERDRIAALIADNFSTQVLTDGFYHADPHSGNVFIMAPVPLPSSAVDGAAGEVKDGEQKLQLPEHPIEWIDFGMMGTLTAKQRQLLIDIVTNVVMHDAYGLKNAVLQVAQPKGEINHGAMLEMCEGMCGQYTGADFGDFYLGDLLGTILSGLQDESFKIDPFLTNLARGITAIEGTIKTLSPNVNILNYFTSKVNTGLNLNLDKEHLKEMNPEIAKVLIQWAKSSIDSSTKTAEVFDMLEKGQIKVHTEVGVSNKSLSVIERLTGYAIRALMIIALFIGSCLLCTVPFATGGGTAVSAVFPVLGIAGYTVSLFFAWRLYINMKKRK